MFNKPIGISPIFVVVAGCLSVMLSNSAYGDAIVVTKAMSASTVAEVFIENDGVRVELEIGASDIEAFQNILPDKIYDKFDLEDPKQFADRLDHFFKSEFVLSGDENPLPGKLLSLSAQKRVIRDEITGSPKSLRPEDGPIVIYAELKYEFVDQQPKSITIQPPGDETNNYAKANIGFITYHRGLPVMDFRYLGKKETLDLDWEDPWYSKFRNKNLRRQFDAPLSVFLYVEPFEVRVELVTRPVDLQRWTELSLPGDGIIPVSQQAELKKIAAEFLRDKISLSINGDVAKNGKLDRIHFVRRTLRKTGVVYPDEDQDTSAATLGVIFVFPIDTLPEQVSLTWHLFNERIQNVPAVATDEAGGLPTTLTAEDPVLEWKNYLTNPTIPAMRAIAPPPTRPTLSLPWVSMMLMLVTLIAVNRIVSAKPGKRGLVSTCLVIALALGGAIWFWHGPRTEFFNPLVSQQKVTEQKASEVTHSLVHNLYHSFDRRDESLIYDQLATCTSGDLLREIYIQIMRQIKLEDQGGARIKIDEIDFLQTDVAFLEDSPGFAADVKWNVVGTIGHWGHVHSRAIQFAAELGIEPVDEDWKIVSLQITDEANLGVVPTK